MLLPMRRKDRGAKKEPAGPVKVRRSPPWQLETEFCQQPEMEPVAQEPTLLSFFSSTSLHPGAVCWVGGHR